MAMSRTESHVREELLAASDAEIEDALEHAEPLVLRGLVYQLTGDEEVRRAHVDVDPTATGGDDRALLRRKAADFLKAMGGVKDFWQEPVYADLLLAMQKRVHDYVVAGQGTAQEALDLLIGDWTEIFQDDGKL